MKLIKQSFEILEQKDKITDTSYEKFVNMLESRGHDRPLEFGTVYLDIPTKEYRARC